MIDTLSPLQGVVIHEGTGEMRQAIIAEYESKGYRVGGPPRSPKPVHLCWICKNHKKSGGWRWTSIGYEWMCLSCLSPASWTSKPRSSVNNW